MSFIAELSKLFYSTTFRAINKFYSSKSWKACGVVYEKPFEFTDI